MCLNHEHEFMNYKNVMSVDCSVGIQCQYYCTSGVEKQTSAPGGDNVKESPSVWDHTETCKTLLLKVCSIDQQHWCHLGASWKCRISCPTLGLLNLNKIRGFPCSLKFEKHPFETIKKLGVDYSRSKIAL